MSTPSEIISMAASLLNDANRQVYTDEAELPYLNMALDELQELFELNNIPSTNETSSILNCPVGTIVIGFNTIGVFLPSNLIEIQRIWESPENLNQWIPTVRYDFLPHYLETIVVNQFRVWAFINQEIRLPLANANIDLKLDYIKTIFNTPIVNGQLNTDLEIKNSKSYLGYRTAALCAEFIAENHTRATELNQFATIALDRTLGISTKGRQSINTRRRPFMASYRTRGY